MVNTTRPSHKWFLFKTFLLFLVAAGLRWIQLPWMSFSMDQAAICQRVSEMLHGQDLFWGIVNSKGFHNAPGYAWALLPVALLTKDPVLITAWHGLLCATMVIPLAFLGHLVRRDAIAWLPAIIAATMPASVFAGRNLWAQFLLPSLGAWILLALVLVLRRSVLDKTPREGNSDERSHAEDSVERSPARGKVAAAAALLLATLAVSVHFSAAALLILCVVTLGTALRQFGRKAGFVLLPAFGVMATMVPSALDGLHRVRNAQEAPAYAQQWIQSLPDPLPWWKRMQVGTKAVFYPQLTEDWPGLDQTFGRALVGGFSVYESSLALLCSLGALLGVRRLLRRQGHSGDFERQVLLLMLAWVTFPIIIAATTQTWLQPSYLAGSLPAAWLLCLFLPTVKGGQPEKIELSQGLPNVKTSVPLGFASVRLSQIISGVFLVSGTILTLASVASIIGHERLPGPYYIPCHWQKKVAMYCAEHGVRQQNLVHLSGPVFELPYRYLIGIYLKKPGKVAAAIDDLSFLTLSAARKSMLVHNSTQRFGTTPVILFKNKKDMENFIGAYNQRQ